MDSVASQNRPGRLSQIVRVALSLLPLAAASVPLLWFSVGGGDRWAHSLFNTEHPLNLGGNSGEVFSHLLNCIVMASAVSSLCLVLLRAIWSQSFRPGEALLSSSILVASMLAVWGWATYLDSRSGEGTVGLAFILFYGPAIAFSRMAAQRLISSPGSRTPRALTVSAIWAVSLGMIWLYEPSGTGGPNILVVPLLGVQVGLFWFASHRFGKPIYHKRSNAGA